MPITLNGDTGIQTPMYNGTITANAVTPSVNMKNKLINSAMVIDQRNAGASVTINTGSGAYTLDRWGCFGVTSDGVYTVQQSSTAPTGFKNSLLATVTTVDSSIGSTEQYVIQQIIEGYNIADLDWGTANAKTITLSFWVRSSLTGTFGGSLRNSAVDRSYPFTYTISSANTFEYKTVTIAGDTSGTWGSTNGEGIRVTFSLGSGSSRVGTAGAWNSNNNTGATGQTNLIATNGATFYITGVQLEVGSTATSFDYRPYTTELGLCYRYCYALYKGDNIYYGMTFYYSSTNARTQIQFPVNMRTKPTINYTGYSSIFRDNGTDPNNVNGWNVNDGNSNTVQLASSNSMSGTAGQTGMLYAAGGAQLIFLAEL